MSSSSGSNNRNESSSTNSSNSNSSSDKERRPPLPSIATNFTATATATGKKNSYHRSPATYPTATIARPPLAAAAATGKPHHQVNAARPPLQGGRGKGGGQGEDDDEEAQYTIRQTARLRKVDCMRLGKLVACQMPLFFSSSRARCHQGRKLNVPLILFI